MRKIFIAFALSLVASATLAQSNSIVTKNSVAELRLNKAATATIYLRSWNGSDLSGGGNLYLDTADTSTADNSCTVFVDAAGHRYKRADAKIIHTDMCDPAGDIGQRANAAYAALPSGGGKIVVDPKADGSCYDYTHTITFTTAGKLVLLEGGQSSSGTESVYNNCLNYTPTSGAAISIDYADGTAGQFTSGSGISNITFINNNCTATAGCGGSAVGILIGLTNAGDQQAIYTNVSVQGFDTGYSELNTSFLVAGQNWVNPSFLGNRIAMTVLGAAETITGGTFAGNGYVFKAPSGSRQAEMYFQGTNMYANSGYPNFDFTAATGFGGISMSNVHIESSAPNDGAHFFEGHVNVSLLNGLLEDDSTSGTGDWMVHLDDNATITMLGTTISTARPYTAILNMDHLYHGLLAPNIASASNAATLASGTFANVINKLPTTTTTGTPIPWFIGTETSFYQMAHALSGFQVGGTTLANFGTCNSGATGQIQYQLDASNTVLGTTAVGSGSGHVFIMCNGSNWIVLAADDKSFPQTMATVTALRANTIPSKSINLAGYSAAGDGGGGTLVYDASDTTTTDNNCTVFVDANGRRYKRIVNKFINVSMCGSNETALLNADTLCAASGLTCNLDLSYTLTANRVLSAKWRGVGGVITTGSFTLSCSCSADPTQPMFDKAGTGLITFTNKPAKIYWDWFSPSKDGSTDDHNSIQRAIDSAAALGGAVAQGGAATYAVSSTVVDKTGVTLNGASEYFGYLNSNPVTQTEIKAITGLSGPVIDTSTGAAGTLHGANITNLNVYGNYPTVPGVTYGIRIRNGNYWYAVRNVMVTLTGNAGIFSDTQSQVGFFENILITGGCFAGNGGGLCGALTISGFDNSAHNIEAGCSQSALSSGYTLGSVMTAGILLSQGTASATDDNIVNAMGEGCDTGYFINSGNNHLNGLRSNFNWGDGVVVANNANVFTGLRVFGNARDAANTYECYYAASGSGANVVDNFECYVPGGNNALKYAINDQVTYGSLPGNQSIYGNVMTLGTITQTYNFADTFIGPRVEIARGGRLILTVNSATPSVDNYESWRTNNSSATTYTNFTNGVNGQRISIEIEDTNSTIANGTNIKTAGGTSITAKGIYTFECYQGVWKEVSAIAF